MAKLMKKAVLPLVFLGLTLGLYGCQAKSGELILTGSVEGNEAMVLAESSGKLTGVFVNSGDQVKVGKLLAQIDDQSVKLQKENLEIARQIGELKYQDLKNGNSKALIRQSIANRDQVKTQLENSQKELSFIKQKLSDMKALVSSGAATKEQVDELERSLEREQSHYDLLSKQLSAAQEGVNLSLEGAVTEQLKAALLEVQMKSNEIEQLDLQLDKYKAKAPTSGYVQTVNYGVNETVLAGQKLFSIIDPSQLELKVYVAEKSLHRVKLGENVSIIADFKTQEPIKGTVNYIASEAEFTPKNIESKESKQEMVFEVRIKIEDPNHMVKPGMYLDANFGSDSQ